MTFGRSWYDKAVAARDKLLTPVKHGAIMAQKTAVAAELGLSEATLRNYLHALRFVESASTDPRMSDRLKQLPAASVNAVARWYEVAPDEARAFAFSPDADFVGITLNIVRKGLDAARSPTTMLEPLPRLRITHPAIASPRNPMVELDHWIKVDDPYEIAYGATDKSVTALASEIHAPYPLAVVAMRLARRQSQTGFRHMGRQIFAKAVLLASLYDLVLVIAPDLASLRNLLRHLPNGDRRTGMEALAQQLHYALSHELGSELAHWQLREPGTLRLPGPRLGRIFFSTPDDLAPNLAPKTRI